MDYPTSKQLEIIADMEKAKQDCYHCEYSIRDDVNGSVCLFYEVIRAAEDRAKEVQPCKK